MAQPSSSHHERRERERSHHRTISSTTLLLTLSLILAVLAVLLSLPSRNNQSPNVPLADSNPASSTLWGYLTPKRSENLVARESSVAMREAEVARREAELLAGSAGGMVIPTASAITCPACPTITETIETIIHQAPGAHPTVFKEYIRDESLAPPGWSNELSRRIEDILDREAKIADREREIGRREESVNRREHDASRREGWIMEQLIAMGNDPNIQEEIIYEQPSGRNVKAIPPSDPSTKILIQTHTVTVPVVPPANTRVAENPLPEHMSTSSSLPSEPTSTVIVDEHGDVLETRSGGGTVTIYRTARSTPMRRPWFAGWY